MLATPLRFRPATVSTPGMVAGAPTWMLPPTRLPAAQTITTSFCSAYRKAASQLCGHSGEVLPREMLMTWAPLSTAQRTASGIWSWSLFPPGLADPSQVETERIWYLKALYEYARRDPELRQFENLDIATLEAMSAGPVEPISTTLE